MDQQIPKQGLGSKALGLAGMAVGTAVGSYSGINLLIPLLATFGIWVIGTSALREQKKLVLPVLAINGGHCLWLVLGLLLLGRSGFTAIGGDVLIYAIGLIWLFLKPGAGPLYLLGIFQVLSLGVNGYSFVGAEIGSAMNKALLVHLIWRCMALFVIVKLYIVLRKMSKRARQLSPSWQELPECKFA